MDNISIPEVLSAALAAHDLAIAQQSGKRLFLAKGYAIEVENAQLFKLLHEGLVVAPFTDVEELCQFIKMDSELYGQD